MSQFGPLDNPSPFAMHASPGHLDPARTHDAFIQSELQHLRELAVLNRAADMLAQRRDPQQIIHDVLEEAQRICSTRDLWLIEPDSQARLLHVHRIDASGQVQDEDPGALPAEVVDLCERATSVQTDQPLLMPPYDPQADGCLYLALPAVTAEHCMGVLAIRTDQPHVAGDSQHLRLLQSVLGHFALAMENVRLFQTMAGTLVEAVIAMALAIESRDPYTGGHSLRVTAFALRLAQEAGLDETDMMTLRLGGLLHDVGKIAVPDAILRKPGRLDDDEFDLMKQHAAAGDQIVRVIPQLDRTRAVVRHHHERYDGRGYPDGLAGDEIALLARITAVADTFDAMTSDRPYRKGMKYEVAFNEIDRCAGSQFDPDLARLFGSLTGDDLCQAVGDLTAWREQANTISYTQLLPMIDLDRLRTHDGDDQDPSLTAAA